MASIRGKNTKPELVIRKKLYELGFRYRIHHPLIGKPDVVFPSKRIAIFVHGCFWHGHGCKNDHVSKTNIKYWSSKIKTNKERDSRVKKTLTKLGWEVIAVLECEAQNTVFNKETFYNSSLTQHIIDANIQSPLWKTGFLHGQNCHN